MNRLLTRLVLCGSALLCTHIGRARDLLFSALFESSADAVIAGGAGKAQTSRGLEFADGYRSQGVRPLPGGMLAYPREGNLDLTSGTITFWFRPEWGLHGPGRITFVKNQAGQLVLTLRRPSGSDSVARPCEFHPGEFSHVVLRWNAASRQIRLWADGRETAGRLENVAPDFFGGPWSLWVGCKSADRFKGDAADAVLDELRIFSADVDPQAIADAIASTDTSLRPVDPASATRRTRPTYRWNRRVAAMSLPWAPPSPACNAETYACGRGLCHRAI